jgi:hypothetical protein
LNFSIVLTKIKLVLIRNIIYFEFFISLSVSDNIIRRISSDLILDLIALDIFFEIGFEDIKVQNVQNMIHVYQLIELLLVRVLHHHRLLLEVTGFDKTLKGFVKLKVSQKSLLNCFYVIFFQIEESNHDFLLNVRHY